MDGFHLYRSQLDAMEVKLASWLFTLVIETFSDVFQGTLILFAF
jgi:hypothetical protein